MSGWRHFVREVRITLAFQFAMWASKLLWRDYPDVALEEATLAIKIGGIETPAWRDRATTKRN